MNYIFKSMLKLKYLDNNSIHCSSLEKLTSKQLLNVKGSIVDVNNRLNGVFPSFIREFSSENRLINIYPSHFSFYFIDKHKKGKKAYIWKLNDLILQVSDNLKMTIVVSDTSIKNQVVTLIVCIHVHDNTVIKTLYHAVNITFTEAKLFTIRYSINQAT